MEALQLIVVALIAGVVGPSVLAFITGRQRKADRIEESKLRREEKEQDWQRQDDVAAQAVKAASLAQEAVAAQAIQAAEAATQAAEAARLLVESNEAVAEIARETNTRLDSKLDIIHTLVNSNMTAAMQSEMDSTIRELAGLKEIVRLNKLAGSAPSEEALAAILSTEAKIVELQTNLNDRRSQAETAEAQAQAG